MAGRFVLFIGIALIGIAIGIAIWYQTGSVKRLFKKEVADKIR
jgi:hypothetical protein